ncbi:MAG: sigma-54-dependent Fis family transcriptional regulator [Pyrinomonadaceae bacterium]|nr:sigma-54-dependent Fis family transcriptional regulator [Pyrinomonadaceae bacterium]
MKALVIDDEASIREFISSTLRSAGWSVGEAESAERAFELLDTETWSLVFCDVVLGGENGFAILRRFAKVQPRAQVVMMTGHGTAVGALDASSFGAYDYLLKPFGVHEVETIARNVRERLLANRSKKKRAEDAPEFYRSDIELVGRSPAFVEAMKLVGRVSQTNLPVLLTGESGTGKEIIARAIHRRSRRADSAFVPVNCGAIPAELIEAELFGHVKGAFTGADHDRAGLFEEAHQGTIFLDEIAETTTAFQVKLLRALQESEIRRVGESRTRQIDVRVIAASNRDVEVEVEEGRFRQDLFYRLNAVTIHLPPLRERREDILPLVEHFAQRTHLTDEHAVIFSAEALAVLEEYDWPGNIRELENAVVRAAALSDSVVTPKDLPERVRRGGKAKEKEARGKQADAAAEEWITLDEAEKRYVSRVLIYTKGNRQAASRILNVDRKTIDRMIKRHGINLDEIRSMTNKKRR